MAEPVELAQLVAFARTAIEGFATANGTNPGTPTEIYSDASSLASYAFVYATVWLVSSGTVIVHGKEKVVSMQIVKNGSHYWVTVLIGSDKAEHAIDLTALQFPDVCSRIPAL